MREIKFRAWDKRKKEFVYTTDGGHIVYNNKMCTNEYGDFLGNYDYEDPEQFTGIYDKNGKEIYEGDVVRDIYDSIFAITFGTFTDTKGHDQVGFYKTYFSIDEDLNVCNGTMDDVDKTCEVIGNVHEGVRE